MSKHPKQGVTQKNYGFCDSTKYRDLDALKALVDAGQLAPRVQRVYPLAELASFHRSLPRVLGLL